MEKLSGSLSFGQYMKPVMLQCSIKAYSVIWIVFKKLNHKVLCLA